MKKETYQLLIYSEGCHPKYKKFKTLAQAQTFIGKFLGKYPGVLRADNYIDSIIENISGPLTIYADDITVD